MAIVQNSMIVHAPAMPFVIRPAPPMPPRAPAVVVGHAPQPVMLAHPVSLVARPFGGMATVNPEMLHFVHPLLGPAGPVQARATRTSFHLPVYVSPDRVPTDATLFQDPQDASKIFHLVRYKLATHPAGTGAVKFVSLEPKAGGFQLVVHLSESVAVPPAAGTPLDAATRYVLTAIQNGSALTWDLTEAGTDGGALKLVLDLPAITDRDHVYHAMTDAAAQARLTVRRSLAIATTIAPNAASSGGWAQSQAAIDTIIDFGFDKQLDSNVFQSLSAAGTTPSGWNVIGLDWDSRRHAYYQDVGDPALLYYLPDYFRIGRQAHAPRVPNMTVSAQGSDPSLLTLTLSFVAYPVWDTKRLADAAARLQDKLGLGGPPKLGMFSASDAKLLLSLPADGGAPGLVPLAGALIDTTSFIQAAVTLKLAQFQQIYAALFDNVSNLLSGEVQVSVNDAIERVPFSARAVDFVGPVFDVTSKVDAPGNRIACQLQNGIESPVHVVNLIAMILRNGVAVPNAVEQVMPALPADFAPGQPNAAPPVPPGALSVTLQAMPGEQLDDTCSAEFDYSQTTVSPDARAIWRAIVQNQVLAPISRTITLRLLASALSPPAPATPPGTAAGAAPATPAGAAPPQDAIVAVQAVFQGGQTASFDGSLTADAGGFLDQKIVLATPMEAIVLGQGVSDTYTYRLDLVTPAGTHAGTWVTDTRNELFLSVG